MVGIDNLVLDVRKISSNTSVLSVKWQSPDMTKSQNTQTYKPKPVELIKQSILGKVSLAFNAAATAYRSWNSNLL